MFACTVCLLASCDHSVFARCIAHSLFELLTLTQLQRTTDSAPDMPPPQKPNGRVLIVSASSTLSDIIQSYCQQMNFTAETLLPSKLPTAHHSSCDILIIDDSTLAAVRNDVKVRMTIICFKETTFRTQYRNAHKHRN